MKARILSLFVLVVSLTLMSSASGALTQRSSSTLWEGVVAQQLAQNVKLVGQIGGQVHAVALQGNYAYIGVGGRLVILNVSDSAHPVVVGQIGVPRVITGVAVAGNYAYIADGGSGLRIVDVSDPAAPSEAGFYDTPGYARGVALAGDYAYVADEGSGLRIVDVSNPAAPSEAGFYDTPGYAMSVALAGSYAYVADYDGGLLILHFDPYHVYLPLVLRNYP